MRTVFSFLIVFLLLVLAAPRALEWLAHQPLPPWQWQALADEFDCNPDHNLVLQAFAQTEFAEGLAMRAEEARDNNRTNIDALCFAPVDLNNDGLEDYILFPALGMLTCGSAGCSFVVYEQKPRGSYRSVGGLFAANSQIYVSHETVNGYRKIFTAARLWNEELHYGLEVKLYETVKTVRTENF